MMLSRVIAVLMLTGLGLAFSADADQWSKTYTLAHSRFTRVTGRSGSTGT